MVLLCQYPLDLNLDDWKNRISRSIISLGFIRLLKFDFVHLELPSRTFANPP